MSDGRKKAPPAPGKGADVIKRINDLSGTPPAVAVIVPDFVRRGRLINLLAEKLAPPSEPGAAAVPAPIRAKECNSAQITRLADDLRALSLFSSTRLYLLAPVEELSADSARKLAEMLEELFKSGAGGATLIVAGAELAVSSPLGKLFKAHDLRFELARLEDAELIRWVQKELKASGLSAWPDSLPEALIDIGEGSPDAIASAIQKLALYVDGDEASMRDVQALFAERYEPGQYEILDAIGGNNPARAEVIMERLLAGGMNQFVLLSMLSRSLSSYTAIRALERRGLSQVQIRETLKMPPWLYGKNAAAARRYSLERLRDHLSQIVRTDSKLKSKNLGNEAVFSELIYRLAES